MNEVDIRLEQINRSVSNLLVKWKTKSGLSLASYTFISDFYDDVQSLGSLVRALEVIVERDYDPNKFDEGEYDDL